MDHAVRRRPHQWLDGPQRMGVNAERMLELAVARKPLPVDHPTAALAYG